VPARLDHRVCRISFWSLKFQATENAAATFAVPEVAVGGTNNDQAGVYQVEVICGTLPCSLFPTGKELTGIVCSK